MSRDLIDPILVKESAIAMIHNERLPVAVESGASTQYQQISANTQSSTNMSFVWQSPNVNIGIDQNMMVRTTVEATINCASVPIGQKAFQYGYSDSLQSFPFNQNIISANLQLNNVSSTVTTQRLIQSLIRTYSQDELSEFNSTTPVYLDNYKAFSDALGANNNPLSAYSTASFDEHLLPRGSFPATLSVVHNITAGGTDTSLISTNTADTWAITLTVTVTESLLLLSPLSNSGKNEVGPLIGINNLSLQLTLDSTLARFFSSATSYITSISGVSYSSSQLLLKYYQFTPIQASKISAKTVVPSYQLVEYPTTFLSTIASGATTSITSNSLNLGVVPETIYISVRKLFSSQNWTDPLQRSNDIIRFRHSSLG
jgi:hypothetical protein